MRHTLIAHPALIAMVAVVALLGAAASLPAVIPRVASAPPQDDTDGAGHSAPVPFLTKIAHLGGFTGHVFSDGSHAWVRLVTQRQMRWVALDLSGRPRLPVVADVSPETFEEILDVRDGLMVAGPRGRPAPITYTVFDASNPAALEPLGQIPLPVTPVGAVWRDGMVYLGLPSSDRLTGERREHLAVLDLNRPSRPVLLGQTDTHVGTPLAIDGNLVFTSVYGSGFCEFPGQPCRLSTVVVVDVSDHDHPAEVGSVVLPWTKAVQRSGPGGTFPDSVPARTVDLVAKDGYVVAAVDTDVLAIIDVRNPRRPEIVDAISASQIAGGGGSGTIRKALHLTGDRLLVVTRQGVVTFDVSDAAHPKELGIARSSSRWESVFGTSLSGDELLVSDGHTDVRLTEVKSPDLLVDLAAYHPVHNVVGVLAEGDLLYAVDNLSFRTIDTSDPEHPGELGRLETEWLGAPAEIAAHQGVAYVAQHGAGIPGYRSLLHMVDVSDPAAPRSLGAVDNVTSPFGLAVVDKTLFVTSPDGLQALDVSDPARPRETSRFALPDAGLFEVRNGLAYVAMKDGLSVVDVSEPSRMRSAGNWVGAHLSSPRLVETGRAIAAVSLLPDSAELFVFDLENPTLPSLVARRPLGRWAGGLVATGTKVAAFTFNNGHAIEVLNLKDPSRPTLVQSVDVENPWRMSINADTLYAVTESGLTAFRISEPPPRAPWSAYLPAARQFVRRADSE